MGHHRFGNLPRALVVIAVRVVVYAENFDLLLERQPARGQILDGSANRGFPLHEWHFWLRFCNRNKSYQAKIYPD